MSKHIAANAALHLNEREVTGNVNRHVRAVLSGAFSSIAHLVSRSRR